MLIDAVGEALAPFGFHLFGSFKLDARDTLPLFADGRPASAVLMVGNAGPAMWKRFSEERRDGASPLDPWTSEVLTQVASRFGASALFPFQRPYLPFQQWALRTGACHLSPLGILIHQEYGLWHALRGALLFEQEIEPVGKAQPPSPCDSCPSRHCLTACPVAAFSIAGYNTSRCLLRLSALDGENCMALGCSARRACPVGVAYRYDPAQARFHMEAFRRAFDLS
jgi:ferredoxin